MSSKLPPLRPGLDLMPSPVEGRPGILIRDPFRYAETVLVIPPTLVPLLAHFDGQHTELDLREALVALTGQLEVGEVLRHLVDTLGGGFLDNDAFARLKQDRHQAFAAAPKRPAAHAGSAYPVEPEALRETLARYMDAGAAAARRRGLRAIAAPHVSPEGGWQSYQAAYAALGPELRDRTFVILGTSHYGEPERFGLTRKPFVTPLGETALDEAAVDWLVGRGGAEPEDYCQAVEHSIEFQVLFLQHLYGPGVRMVPILCGPFARATFEGGYPEDDAGVGRCLEALGALAAREGDRLFWVLGVDLTHMGRRYGDAFRARAGWGKMAAVAAEDRRRMERVAAGDAHGFWKLVQDGGDTLRWCGASPLYTFLEAAGSARGELLRGELLRYDQWNIDDASVVTFAGLAFS